MRVAFDLISETGVPGGIRTYWTSLIDRLARLYPDDEWTLIGARDLLVPEPLLERSNVRFVPLGRSARSVMRRRLRQQLLLPAVLARESFDCVHSINNVAPLASTIPRVLTVLDLTARHTPERFSFAKRWFLTMLVPWSARRARRIISISHVTRRDLLAAVPELPEDKIDVIHLGVAPCFHHRTDADESAALRERYSLPPRFTFFVGALEPGKNLAGMLDALEILQRRAGAAPPLVIAGGGDDGAIRERIAGSLPVQLLGRVPDADLPALYRSAAAFLFPSLWEGFGLPVLEAFASGTPVITSDRSALTEVAGNAALLVDPHDPGAIADAWDTLWRDDHLAARLRRLGLERAECFTWERVAQLTHGVYDTVLTGNTRLPELSV